MSDRGRRLVRMIKAAVARPRFTARHLLSAAEAGRGTGYASRLPAWKAGAEGSSRVRPGSLREYFEGHLEGPGIYKWTHYFDIYERHFARFRGRPVHVAEVGVFSGGSLQMWKWYFGDEAVVTGIDIEPACAAYADERTTIMIGDQAERSFWRRFREQRPAVDVFIDDGGHLPEQQIVTLEEVMAHMAPGGVYVCEDIHGSPHDFSAYVSALADSLHASTIHPGPESGRASEATAWQSRVASIHAYPFVWILELNPSPTPGFTSVRRGTEWQPFL